MISSGIRPPQTERWMLAREARFSMLNWTGDEFRCVKLLAMDQPRLIMQIKLRGFDKQLMGQVMIY